MTRGRSWPAGASPAGPKLHSRPARDVIAVQTRRATGGAHRERWGDGPREAAATGEAYEPRGRCQLPRRRLREMSRTATKSLSAARARSQGEAKAKPRREGLLLSLNFREL